MVLIWWFEYCSQILLNNNQYFELDERLKKGNKRKTGKFSIKRVNGENIMKRLFTENKIHFLFGQEQLLTTRKSQTTAAFPDLLKLEAMAQVRRQEMTKPVTLVEIKYLSANIIFLAFFFNSWILKA